MDIRLNMGKFSSFLAVPTDVVDKHLSTASGIYLKVLLAVMRANRTDTAQIAHKLSIPESDVVEAIGYWIQSGIFEELPAQKEKKEKPSESQPRVVVSAQSLTAAEITDRVNRNPEIRFLFSAVETIIGNVLTSTQQRVLIFIHENYNLPVDVVLMAVEYCYSIGKNNINYIQKLCNSWADQGINTHTLAEETIRQLNIRRTVNHQIVEMLGLSDRPLTPEQQRYIDSWTQKLGYGPDVIRIAYERTLNGINKLSLPYMNSILKSWYEKGIRTPEEIEMKDARPRLNGSGGNAQKGWEPSYDIDELERRGLSVPKFD